jgi:glycosyltransferase involved in cell wall biosynthesis
MGAVVASGGVRENRARLQGARSHRIRVLQCLDNMNVGGTELNAVRTAELLDRSRFDLSVLCLNETGPLLARYAAAGIPVFFSPISNLFGPQAIARGMRLARFLAVHRIDVVHSHDQYNNIFATMWARVAGTPVVMASRRWWHSLPERRYRIGNAIAFRAAHCVLANSPSVAAALRDVDGVNSARVAVVPNFVDETAFVPLVPEKHRDTLRALGVPGGALVVGIVARLSTVKDHASLLQAVSLLVPRWPQLHLVLFGDGECRSSLEALARRLGIAERTHFGGLQPNEPNLHHLFDLSVLCSISEGFPNSIVEAMAAARPVVATDVGGNSDAVRAGETGLLVSPREPEQLAAALETLLRDPDLRRKMGAAAQRRARQEFHGDRVLPALEALYDRLVRERAAGILN